MDGVVTSPPNRCTMSTGWGNVERARAADGPREGRVFSFRLGDDGHVLHDDLSVLLIAFLMVSAPSRRPRWQAVCIGRAPRADYCLPNIKGTNITRWTAIELPTGSDIFLPFFCRCRLQHLHGTARADLTGEGSNVHPPQPLSSVDLKGYRVWRDHKSNDVR